MTLFSLAFLLSGFTHKSDGGIDFYHGKFNEAKKLAKEQNKTIFIDSYTEWCGPCKKMSKEVFTQSEVGSYFNNRFVSIKLDMEKSEGLYVSRKYNISFYPTLLFITPEGTLLRKEVGYHTKSQLLKLAREIPN